MKMKMILLLVSMFLVFMPTTSADLEMNTDIDNEIKEVSWWNSLLEVYVSDIDYIDPLNSYVNPGQAVTLDIVVCNFGSTSTTYHTEVYIIDPNGVGDDIFISPSNPLLAPDSCGPDYIKTFNAPTQPGKYKVIAYSYMGSAWALDDTDYFWLNVKSTATPTPTPGITPVSTPAPGVTPSSTPGVTPANNPPTAKISYVLMGGGKVILKGVESSDSDGTIEKYSWTINGAFVNGQSTFTQVFDTEGTYEIGLTVEDDDGATAKATLIIPVKMDENKISIPESNIDATAAEATGTDSRTGVWFEDGALKAPGFDLLVSLTGLLLMVFVVGRRHE